MGDRQISGAVATALPGRFDAARAQLQNLDGIDVHETDPITHRLVITIEAASIDEARERFAAAQALPDIAHAELVMHHTGD